MKTSTKLAIGIGAAFAGGIGATLGYQELYEANGFVRNAIDSYMRPPWSHTKVLAILAAVVMLPALLLGVLEWRADRAYRRELKALRASDLMADVVEYEGPEGSGVLLLGPLSRRVLLRPVGGLGAPRVVDLASAAELRGSADPAGDALPP